MPTTIEEVTTGSITGTGAFDKFMAGLDVHLIKEYQKGRLTGPDYAKVYLGSIQSALQLGMQFTFEKQQSDLLRAQVLLAQKETELKDKELQLADKELLIKDQEILKSTKEVEVLEIQKGKIDQERQLLEQKKITESAQTQDNVASSASILGRQGELYRQQAEGFIRDAEQKATKMIIDTWMLRRSTNDQTFATNVNKLNDLNVGEAISTMMAGAGMTPDNTIATST